MRIVALTLSLVLGWTAAGQSPHEQEMRERLLRIGEGFMAEVTLAAGGKLTGRIGPIHERDFVLEEVRERKLQDQTLAFADLKSVGVTATRRKGMATHLVLSIAASLGISFLIRLIRR